MTELPTNDRENIISRKIQKMNKHEKGLEAIRKNIRSSDIVDVIATFPADIRPTILSFRHISHGCNTRSMHTDYVLIPQRLTEYAIVITGYTHYVGPHKGHSLFFKIDPFEFRFPMQSISSQYLCEGIGEVIDGYLHGSGREPLEVLAKRGIKVLFAENASGQIRKTNTGNLLEIPITSWRTLVLEEYGAKVVRKYMDSWLKVVGEEKPAPVESDRNPDMDCHPDHIQSVIDRHEQFEYEQSMRGENPEC